MQGVIMTFNIRYDNPYDGQNCWNRRRDFVFETLLKKSPDILCLQEVLPHVKNDLEKNMTDYNFCGCGRDEHLQGEYNPIGYRRDKFDLLFTQTFWLGSKSDVAGSMNPYSVDLPRICTQMILREKESGKVFAVYNTHLDHMSAKARIWGMNMIFEQMRKFASLDSFITGDFNAFPDSEEMRYFETYNPLSLLNFSDTSSLPVPFTYHDFTGREQSSKIDYIYATPAVQKLSFDTVRDTREDLELSDHYPCICTFAL